ncbi:DUF58 domain-containing protein [Kineococcus radiotolerans]|uniref:Uncharacterized protein n=1 Tax=Kineococcus radiotolerans (strain ATCC BAA-149 / DSM 14245 / SRS30216) TaxID=266940 RepID=A6W8N1_KINRD|nr:DUF58 domain-containing protein [Kineococcus radiotolerans]ABS03170.1 protein of unknown function DUF58 [Kineococcus radiotolerans SRS30216 = ATCC BAA-149]
MTAPDREVRLGAAPRAPRLRPVLTATAGPALVLLSFGVGNRWLTLLGCLLLGAVGVAAATSPRVRSLAVRVDVPARTRAGDVVEHVVHVRNTGSRDLPAALLRLRGDGFAEVHCGLPAVAAGAVVSVRVPRRAGRRGLSGGPEVVVEACDSLGLLLVSGSGRVPAPVHVHPAPAPVPVLPAPPASAGGLDVAGVRPFRRGDGASSLHRRASARRGAAGRGPGGPGAGLVVVEREAEAAGPLVVVLGASGVEDEVAWEELVASAAALVRRELASGGAVRVVAGGASAAGPGALDVLAAVGAPEPVAAGVVAARRSAGRSGRVLVGELVAGGARARWGYAS